MCFELFEVFLTSSADQWLLSLFVVDDLHLQIIEIISPQSIWPAGYIKIIGPLHWPGGGGGEKLFSFGPGVFIL